ncbi:hypothetical protein ABT235_20825 [Micromonospora echinofusca]|uniref:hypothetical protein n=1 Tax=Micromonospora echinofusca TaxID=47858 RepID=UPI000CBCAC70
MNSTPGRQPNSHRRGIVDPSHETFDDARAVQAAHTDNDGMCHGCHIAYQQLKPFPCEYARWAARYLASTLKQEDPGP